MIVGLQCVTAVEIQKTRDSKTMADAALASVRVGIYSKHFLLTWADGHAAIQSSASRTMGITNRRTANGFRGATNPRTAGRNRRPVARPPSKAIQERERLSADRAQRIGPLLGLDPRHRPYHRPRHPWLRPGRPRQRPRRPQERPLRPRLRLQPGLRRRPQRPPLVPLRRLLPRLRPGPLRAAALRRRLRLASLVPMSSRFPPV